MKILNFGSLNQDYVYKVDHFVQPGETILSDHLDIFCGGKGLNQSIALARAGASVFHAGKIGADGQKMLDLLIDNQVDTRFVRQAECPSGHALIQVDKTGQNCIILFGGANQQIEDDEIDQTLEGFSADDILLLQNEINNMSLIMRKAHERGMRIALNPSPITLDLLHYPLQYVDWFILNEIEAAVLSNETDPDRMATRIVERYPKSAVILTLGDKGAIYHDRVKTIQQEALTVPVKDTTAAGDTFTGFFMASLSESRPIEEALQIAAAAAAICVSRPGASSSIPWREELKI